MEGGKSSGVFTSAECGEVFTKQDLTTERQRTSKALGRPRRKEKRSRGGSQMNSQDIMRKIKLSSEMLHAPDKENSDTISSLITKNRISQKVGIYSKSKSSETISRRKPLEGLKLTESAANAAKNDLRRVIGSCTANPLASAPTPPAMSPPTETAPSATKPSPADSLDSNPPPPTTMMEVSPPCEPPQAKPLPPLEDTAMRIVEGLRPLHVFKCGNTLMDTKVELRRMIKQQNPSLFQQLTQYVHKGQTLTPHLMACPGLPRELPQVLRPSSSSTSEPLIGAPPAQSKATATSSELSVLFGHHCPQPHQPHQPHQPPQLPSNPVSAPDVREIPRHHGSYNLSHNGSYNPPPQITGAVPQNPTQSSADFLDIVDYATPTVWHPSVPSPSPDRPKLFPHRLY